MIIKEKDMSYKERQTWVLLCTNILVTVLYIAKIISVYKVEGDLLFQQTELLAKIMLIYMGIVIVLIILVMILFNVILAIKTAMTSHAKGQSEDTINQEIEENIDSVEDEMDKLISLKAGHVGYIVVSITFVIGLITLVLGSPVGILLNMVYLGFMLGTMIEGLVKLFFYKRGVSHG